MEESKPHILVGTPCYGGMVHEGYMHNSLISATTALPANNISVSIKTITNESLVTRARNHISDAFFGKSLFFYTFTLY